MVKEYLRVRTTLNTKQF